MRDMVSDLYRVMDVFDDITVHQGVGKWPKVGDLVRVVARSANRNAVYAESNGGNYAAFFLDYQVKGLDEFLNIQGNMRDRTAIIAN